MKHQLTCSLLDRFETLKEKGFVINSKSSDIPQSTTDTDFMPDHQYELVEFHPDWGSDAFRLAVKLEDAIECADALTHLLAFAPSENLHKDDSSISAPTSEVKTSYHVINRNTGELCHS